MKNNFFTLKQRFLITLLLFILMDFQKKSSLCGQEVVGRPSVRSDFFQSVSDIFDVFDLV